MVNKSEYTNQQLLKLSEPNMFYFALGTDDKEKLRKMQGVGFHVGKRYNTQDRVEIHNYVRLFCHHQKCILSNMVDMLCFCQDNWTEFVAWLKIDHPTEWEQKKNEIRETLKTK